MTLHVLSVFATSKMQSIGTVLKRRVGEWGKGERNMSLHLYFSLQVTVLGNVVSVPFDF